MDFENSFTEILGKWAIGLRKQTLRVPYLLEFKFLLKTEIVWLQLVLLPNKYGTTQYLQESPFGSGGGGGGNSSAGSSISGRAGPSNRERQYRMLITVHLVVYVITVDDNKKCSIQLGFEIQSSYAIERCKKVKKV